MSHHTTLNLADFVREHARYSPDKTAVRMAEASYTYAQVNAVANQVANYLTSVGVQAGDKVALSCPNLPYFTFIYYGILKAGAVVAPLNVLLKGREIAYHLKDSDAKVYFCFEGTDELPMAQMGKQGFDEAPACEQFIVMTADPAASSPIEGATTLGSILASQAPTFEAVATAPDDTAVILYTSGTTGQPKGAELSHLNMVLNARASAELFALPDQMASDSVGLVVLPLFHSFGQTCIQNAIFYNGGTITLLPRFDAAQAWQVMRSHGVNVFAGVPTMYWAMLNEAKSLSAEDLAFYKENLKVCSSGGSAMPVELLKNFEQTFGVSIMEGYGLSETSPVASFNNMRRERKPGSVGQPILGVDIKIVDSDDNEVATGELGEIVIRGHNIMKGYYKRPEATSEAMRGGWFHSGDIGRKDEEGYIYIADRVKDMILRGGFNVYPREIEEVLVTHPDVSMAAVVGLPDESHGEEIRAYLVMKEGAEATSDDIIDWSKEQMAAYKYPREVIFRDSLPMNATGKILKRELRDEAQTAD